MLVIIAYHAGDLERAINLICWMRELDGEHKVHRILTVADYDITVEQEDRVKAAAYDAFEGAFNCRASRPEKRGWPWAPNLMFQTACGYNRKNIKEDFFWCESDCIPVKKGWLDQIQKEYKAIGKPFMGYFHSKPWMHLTGCAVYPWNIVDYNSQILMANETPWDCVNPMPTLRLAHNTKLIQHVWSYKGDKLDSPAPTFQDRASLGQINDDAVVFHRNKDGTLIDRLRGVPTNTPVVLQGDVCLLQLGRYGDIMNILPVAKRIAQSYGKPPAMMVARKFADILDGVSYVHRVIFDGEFSEVEAAQIEAEKKFQLVITSQVWGTTWQVPHECQSYNMESWRCAGFLPQWGERDKLVFDRADVPTKISPRPMLCLCLSSGHSSPFKEWKPVQEHIVEKYADRFEILDLADMHCDRVYDLLRWIRGARLLITSDTSPLHLAAACSTPVVALVNDDPWLASTPRCNAVLKMPYRDVLGRLEEIDSVIEKHAGIGGAVRKAGRLITV